MIRPNRTRNIWIAAALLSIFNGAMTQGASFQVLIPPASFGNPVYGDAISADGSTVAGEWFLPGTDAACGIPGGCTRAFRWTAATGFQDLALAGGVEAQRYGLTANGLQVVGSAGTTTAFRRAVVWTAATGFVDIGTPRFPNDPDHSVIYGYGISGNGSVVVGRAIPTQASLIPHSTPPTATEIGTASRPLRRTRTPRTVSSRSTETAGRARAPPAPIGRRTSTGSGTTGSRSPEG